MKKYFFIFIIITLIFIIVPGCNYQDYEGVKIGLAAPKNTHGWVAGVSYYAEKYCKENKIDYNLTTSSDAEEMKNNLNKLVDWGAEAIVMWPQWSGMESAVDKIIEKGIPVIGFDVDINCDNVYKVTGNNYYMGYQCAQYITEKVGDSAAIAIMDVPSMGSVAKLRKQGFYDYLHEIGYDDSNVICVKESEFSRDAGYNDMKTLLASNKNIDAVFSMDDETSIGVVNAIMEEETTSVKAITGGGGMQEYFNMIADERYENLGLASALYSPSMIEDAISTAIERLKESNSSKIIVLPTSIVDKSNVEDYIDKNNTVY